MSLATCICAFPLFLIAMIAHLSPCSGCTGTILRATDGAVVIGRTMEFGVDLGSYLLVIPAGETFSTLEGEDKGGFTYKSKYGMAGMNALNRSILADGVNQHGLYFGAFYFAGSAWYEPLTTDNQDNAIASHEMGNWILSQYKTVQEVRDGLSSVTVVGVDIPEIHGFAPLHFAVTDAAGDSIVVEYTEKAGRVVHDNTVNAVTNNPTYDWMITNLANYMGLTAKNNQPSITVGTEVIRNIGQGTGMYGLPGDFSAPSRFVRATAYANTAETMENAWQGVQAVFHIENNFDIPRGSIREYSSTGSDDYTQWTTAVDTKNLKYYWKGHTSQQVEFVDVKTALASVQKYTSIAIQSDFVPVDRTPGACSGGTCSST